MRFILLFGLFPFFLTSCVPTGSKSNREPVNRSDSQKPADANDHPDGKTPEPDQKGRLTDEDNESQTDLRDIRSAKMIFLYVGPTVNRVYQDFSTNDIKNLNNITQFILSASPAFTALQFGDNCKYPAVVDAMKRHVNTINQARGHNKTPVWIGLPAADGTTSFSRQEECVKVYLTDVKAALGTLWDQVIGIYLNAEDVKPGSYPVSNPYKGTAVKYLKNVADHVRGTYSLKTIWSTYYSLSESYAPTYINIWGHTVNRTDIFDVVLIQPAYYFTGIHSWHQSPKSNLNGVYHSMEKQLITYRDGVPTSQRSADCRAVIGVQMEVDAHALKDPAAMKRYREYEEVLRPLLGKAPFSYYADSRDTNDDVWMQISNLVNDFYKQ